MQREFNFIYEKLVSDENDIIGHIAYSLYKKDKLNYIKEKKENNIALTEDQLKPFNEISSTESSVESYTIKAELLLQAFFENTFEELTSDLEDEAISNQSQILENIISPIRPAFWKRVWSGLVSAFIFALILAIIAFILQFRGSVINVEVQKPNVNNTQIKVQESNIEINEPE